MPTKKKSTIGKSASKRSTSKKSAGPNSAAQPRKKPAASRSEVTQKLWTYIKKNGLANRNAQRHIFNTPVQLRHLDATDITRILSDAKVKLI
jgi:chromatin remodeling complex protein RSC6